MSRRSLAFVLPVLTITRLAHAHDDRAACAASFETAELRLRPSEGRLLDARTALRACALPSCQAWMVDDCTKRLAEVEGRIPSVVFSAENARGVPVYDVHVFENERELAPQIDGRAIEIDPGPHELVAVRGDARVPLSVVVIEGKKAQQIRFAFHDAPAPAPVVEPPPPPPREVAAHPWARPLAEGFVLGAVVSSGIGVGFGIAAIGKKHDAHCDANDVCDTDQAKLDSARHTAQASTVSFVIGGGLLLAGGVTYLLFGRTRVRAGLNHVGVATVW